MPLTLFNNNPNGIAQPSPAGLATVPGPYTLSFQRTDIAFDYAIAGIPFIGGESLRGTYFRKVYQRTFSPIRKDQFDNQQVPGEQSIWGWWLRSQSNFSQGAGVQFLDTTVDPTLSQRYFYSEGLDTLSTPGQATLLTQANAYSYPGATGPVKLRGAFSGPGITSGQNGVLALDVGAATLKFLAGANSVSYAMPAAVGTLANTLTDDGTNYYFAATSGIYKGTISSAAAATKIWNGNGTNTIVLGWIKGRLVAGIGNSVYELVGTGPALPTPKFTHQNGFYQFTEVSEIQSAILVSGHVNNMTSQIHKFVLDSGGALPTLTSGVVCAQMPIGEYILSMYAYIGAFVGIGTNRGFRVAVADSSGNLTYGPLVLQDPTGVGVQAIAGYDRFMYIGNQGNKLIPQAGWVNPPEATVTDGLIRIDLSQLTSTNSQPFANDLMPFNAITNLPVAATGSPINSIANVGNSKDLAWSTGTNIYGTSTGTGNALVPTGYIYTPKIRYNTLEPKHFKYIYMRHQNITTGSIDILGQNPNMQLSNIALNVVGSSVSSAQTPFFIADVGNAQEWFQFKFVLHLGTGATSPVFNGYQLRSLPGVSRQTIIEIPLLCLDHETDRNGVLHGTDGYAFQRLTAVESLTASGNIVLLQDLNYGVNNLVVVEDYKFEQQSPELAKTSSAGNQDSNARGGYIILQCRVIM